MTIVVTQPDSETAASCVTILANRELIGGIGPGESLMFSVDTDVCQVDAYCGSYHTWDILKADAKLQIRWAPTAERMELVPAKN
jgi:hypothetical protein